MLEFYRTVAGRKFFDADVPSFLRQLERLNDNLEKLTEAVGRRSLTGEQDHGDDPRD